MSSFLPYIILTCMHFGTAVTEVTVSSDTYPHNGATVRLTCTITSFTLPSSWINDTSSGTLSTCINTGLCTRTSFGRYSYSANSSAIIAQISGFNAFIDNFGWKCQHEADVFVFKFTYSDPPVVQLFPNASRINVTEGSTFEFGCNVTNANPIPQLDAYSWLLGGRVIEGQNRSSLELLNIQKSQDGMYQCTARNEYGIGYSGTMELNVQSHNATAAPSVLERSDIDCQTTSLNIFVPKSVVPAHGTVTWRDYGCVVHSNGTHYVDSLGLRACGTTLNLEQDSVVFENELIFHKNGSLMQNGNSIVTYGSDYEFAIPVKCVYPRNSNISTSYIPIVQQVKILERRNGHLDLTMRQYEAEDYSHPVPFNAYPRQVPLNNDIFIRLAMENNVTGLGLSADNCFATSSPSPVDPNWYQLISSGCPVNNARIHPSGTNDVKFSFHAFSFRHNTSGIVYIHCQVSICLDTDPACVVGCVTRKKRSASAREGAITSNLISTGPFVLTNDDDGVNMSTVVAGVSIAAAVIATVVAIIGWKRKIKKGADF